MAWIARSKFEINYCNLFQVFFLLIIQITKLFLCKARHSFTIVCWIESFWVFWLFLDNYGVFSSLFFAFVSQKPSWLKIKSAETTILGKGPKDASLFQYRTFTLSLFFNKNCSYLFLRLILAVWCFLWWPLGMDWLKTFVRLSKKLLIFFYLSRADENFRVFDLLIKVTYELSREVAALENFVEERTLFEIDLIFDDYRLNCIYYDIKHA